MGKTTLKNRKTIGRIDKADFPDLGIENLEVKIDTGAYRSSLHCETAEEVNKGNVPILVYTLLHNGKTYKFETAHFSRKTVKSSTGIPEERFMIETSIVLFQHTYATSFSLSNRENMKYPVLLGRTLLSRNFLVDTARTDLSYKQKCSNSASN